MNRIKELRKSRGLTQEELGLLMGVHYRTIQGWENDGTQIKPSKTKQLADYFGVSIPYLLGYDSEDTLADLIAKINQWAIDKGLDKSDPRIQWMKVTEEVGEIRDVFLKPHDFADPEWSLKDAIGDSIVTLVVLCLQLGYDVEECLTIAYNDIKDRQGVMIDDNFIKTKTRQPANDSDDSTSGVASH